MGMRVPGSNPDLGMGAFNKQVCPIYDDLFPFAKLRWEMEIHHI